MKILSWNIRRAGENSQVWKILRDINPEIALLQEVSEIPKNIKSLFSIKIKKAIKKNGEKQKFSTAIFVKGEITSDLQLSSEYEWVNTLLKHYSGNLIGCVAEIEGYPKLNIISVYSPAWPIDTKKLGDVDISTIRLKEDNDLWVTEILWSALKKIKTPKDAKWVVGGDYNSSETFDKDWQIKNGIRYSLSSSGNKEILNRMSEIGFKECLRGYNRKIVPTFKNTNGGLVVHQMDHLFVTNDLYVKLKNCTVGDKNIVFGQSLSDHLPIIAEYK